MQEKKQPRAEQSEPMTAAAYPRFLLRDGQMTDEDPLPGVFHERFPAHFIGQRGASDVWPAHSAEPEAVANFVAGQRALYDDKDSVAAIRSYEAALDLDPMYLQAWVALAIACVTDNTTDNLDRAEEILNRLSQLPAGDWLSSELASIIRQNLAYVHLFRYRQTADHEQLERADAEYGRADTLSRQNRVELLCPWAYVKLERGDTSAAREIWQRAESAASGLPNVLEEYAGKYVSLRRLREI